MATHTRTRRWSRWVGTTDDVAHIVAEAIALVSALPVAEHERFRSNFEVESVGMTEEHSDPEKWLAEVSASDLRLVRRLRLYATTGSQGLTLMIWWSRQRVYSAAWINASGTDPVAVEGLVARLGDALAVGGSSRDWLRHYVTWFLIPLSVSVGAASVLMRNWTSTTAEIIKFALLAVMLAACGLSVWATRSQRLVLRANGEVSGQSRRRLIQGAAWLAGATVVAVLGALADRLIAR